MLSGAISPLYLEIKFEITVEKAYMSSPLPSTYTVVLIVVDVYGFIHLHIFWIVPSNFYIARSEHTLYALIWSILIASLNGCPSYLGRDLWVSRLWGRAVILPPSRLLSGRFDNKIVLIHFAQSTTLHTWKVLRSGNFGVKITCAFIFC